MGKSILHLFCCNKNMKSKECVICGQEECSQEEASFCCLAISTDTWKKKTCLPILFFFIQLLQNVKLINSLGRRDQIWVFLPWTSCPTCWVWVKVVNLPFLRVELNVASSLHCVTALQRGLVAKSGCCYSFYLFFLSFCVVVPVLPWWVRCAESTAACSGTPWSLFVSVTWIWQQHSSAAMGVSARGTRHWGAHWELQQGHFSLWLRRYILCKSKLVGLGSLTVGWRDVILSLLLGWECPSVLADG